MAVAFSSSTLWGDLQLGLWQPKVDVPSPAIFVMTRPEVYVAQTCGHFQPFYVVTETGYSSWEIRSDLRL